VCVCVCVCVRVCVCTDKLFCPIQPARVNGHDLETLEWFPLTTPDTVPGQGGGHAVKLGFIDLRGRPSRQGSRKDVHSYKDNKREWWTDKKHEWCEHHRQKTSKSSPISFLA
jgi:hypothetical protein